MMDNGRIEYNRPVVQRRINGIPYTQQPKRQGRASNGIDFKNILQDAISQEKSVKFSKHAQERLSQRSISLSNTEIDKINTAVEKARAKGVKDSLILIGNLAFIVNIPSKTVVTAVDGENIRDNVFTNIDGAVLL
ncbi:MAG: flagellar biosynthesis protein [Clostridiales bacterium]|jgi:flagellar operon protein|nr:flagellar biosynthesis protein [Clostridiales bacterium]